MRWKTRGISSGFENDSGIFYLAFSSFLVFLPFFFLGLILIRIFSERAKDIGKVYGLNLFASGMGAMLALFLLKPLGMNKALILACLVLGFAGLLFALGSGRNPGNWSYRDTPAA